eukprot:TRINITY_DN291_c0_g1_i1.p1 TRINITY_DN291_c0_g1~~TRINITY_DN291_c0_g1_i1.p1  ORF type:complete len:236 (+),score=33.40 TRINITY_DN291_c0_g1_i1:104-811(+)
MFGIALDISIADFRRLARKPKPLFVGVLSQFVLLPVVTFVLVLLVEPLPSIALGMFMVAACPGGNISVLCVDTTLDKQKSLQDLKGTKGTVIMFICNHCPFVKHLNADIVKTAMEYQPKDISFIAISSNDVENYPQDAPHLMKLISMEQKYTFPYLYDESQDVAKAYDAACTPDFYLFDANLKLVYRGQFDNSRPGNGIPVTGEDLKTAMDALLAGKEINEKQKPSMGCNIKWKK